MASGGTFLRYSFLQIFKNSRRTFSAIIGVTLAVTLVAAESISVDSSARAVMDSLLAGVPVDMMARTAATTDYLTVARSLSRVSLVDGVEPISGYQYATLARHSSNSSAAFPLNLSGVEPTFGKVASRFGFRGDFRLSPGGIVISENLSALVGVRAGQSITLVERVLVGYANHTYEPVYRDNTVELSVSAVVSHERVPDSYTIVSESPSIYNPGGRENPAKTGEMGRYFSKNAAAFVELGELGGIVARLREGSDSYAMREVDQHFNRTFHYCIWTQRYSVLNPFDPDGSRQSLAKLEQRLTLAGDEFSVDIFENDLEPVLTRTYDSAISERGKYLAFSLPVIFLGFYLGMLGVDMGMAERRQEAALVKSRGATRSHLLRLFLVEGVFLGILAGVLGLVAGALISAALFSYFVPAASGLSPGLYITDISVELGMFLGVLLMVLAMFLPARRAVRTEISEGLHYYSTEEATEKYNPKWAVLFTVLSVLFYLVIMLFDPQKWYEEGRSLDILYFVLSVLRGIGSLISWLIPVLLIFGVTSLLTRASYRPYSFLARMTRPLTGELWPVVERNLVRNPKRASRVCIIIAVSITFGILVTTWAGTESDHQLALSRVIVGADVRATFPSSVAYNASMGPALDSLPRVDGAAWAYSISGASIAQGGVDLFALQSRNYSRVALLDERLFLEGSLADVASLAGGKRIIINQALQAQSSAGAGDTVLVKISVPGQGQPVQLSCRIVAVVKVLPGMVGDVYSGYIQNILPGAYIDVGNLDLNSVTVGQAAAFVHSGSPRQVAREIKAAFPAVRPWQVLVEEDYLVGLQGGPVSVADYKFLLIESGFAVVIVTVGLALILMAAVYERRKETAGWMARGATRRQVASIFVAEATTLLTLALAVGLVVGFMTAYMALGLFGTTGVDPVGRTLVFSTDTFWLLAATAASLLLTSYAVAWKASRVDLAQVLRLRGG
jgi:putative ABC transport system permease protein